MMFGSADSRSLLILWLLLNSLTVNVSSAGPVANFPLTNSSESVQLDNQTKAIDDVTPFITAEYPDVDFTDSSVFDSLLDTNYTANNTGLEDNDSEGTKSKTTDILGMVMEPIFFSTGVVGNSLAIRVLLTKEFRAMPVSLTLVCLAFSDMTVTILHPFNRPFFRELIQVDIRSINGDVGCKVFFWVWRTAKMTSSWFVVFVCIERFFAIWLPFKVKQISNRRNSIGCLILIYVSIGSFNCVWTFASGLKNGTICVPDLEAKGYEDITRIFLLCGTTLYSLLPSALMIIFTTLTVGKLIVSREERMKMSAAAKVVDAATMKVTTMLIGITVAYVILVNPHAILHNVAFASGQDFFETTSPDLKTGREVAQVLEQINYSINFFLYILCCTQFRKKTAQVLGLGRCAKAIGRNESAMTNTTD